METVLATPTITLDSEAALVRRLFAGDEGALESLYAAYSRRLFAYA